jgi:hypothetical protein
MRFDPFLLAQPILRALPLSPAMEIVETTRQWVARELGDRLGYDIALKTAVDRAAIAYRLVCGPSLSASEWGEVAHEVESARRLYRARGWLDNPAAFHEAPPPMAEMEEAFTVFMPAGEKKKLVDALRRTHRDLAKALLMWAAAQ